MFELSSITRVVVGHFVSMARVYGCAYQIHRAIGDWASALADYTQLMKELHVVRIISMLPKCCRRLDKNYLSERLATAFKYIQRDTVTLNS